MMVEVRFEKDVMNDYMIIQRQTGDKQSVYEAQILHNNDISGLLSLKIKEENDITEYYYDVHHLKSLTDISSFEGIGYDEAVRLFRSIRDCLKNIDDYLLSFDGVCLDERYIYRDYQSQCYIFAYVPGYEDNISVQMKNLLAWLMKHINYNDKNCVSYIYNLYRKLENNENIFIDEPIPEECSSAKESRKYGKVRKIDLNDQIVFQNIADQDLVSDGFADDRKKETDKNRRKTFPVIVAAVSAAVLAVTIIFRKNISYWFRTLIGVYLFPWIWPTGVLVIEMIVNLSCLIYRFRVRDEDREFWNENSTMDFAAMKNDETRILDAGDDKEYSKTQLLNQNVLRLVGMQEEETEIIEVCELPFTIGKNREIVQYAIKNPAVSRRHLQIQTNNDTYYVTDLYSTNGSRINGRSLSPGKAYEINTGDKLQIADMVYEVQQMESYFG